MKRSRLSYDEWKCIVSKDISGKTINSELLNGYIGLIDIKEVDKAQIWKYNGEEIVVCDKGNGCRFCLVMIGIVLRLCWMKMKKFCCGILI